MANKVDPIRHLKIVEKIPFVKGLSMHQVQQVLKVGSLEVMPPKHILCRDGDKSTALYILLAGELVVTDGNTELARIEPVDIVGEMGVVTNQPRCATIQVSRDATVITVAKMPFDVLLKNDIDMAARIYRNMLSSLSTKLRTNNQRLKKDRSANDNDLVAASV